NTGLAAGRNDTGAVILKTTDGGATWTTIYQGTTVGDYVWKLQILASNPNVIFGSVETVAPNSGKLLKSADGGVTWISKNAPEAEVQAVGFVNENHGWMGGHDTGFYETTDGGDTWTNTAVGSNLNRIFFVDNSTAAYACGTTIYKMSTNLTATNFQEQARIPLTVRVAPNPIKDKLNVEIDFRGIDHIVLGLYSNTGQFIKELKLDEINQAGTKKYSFDFPYASGVYFLNLHTNTGRQSVKISK
ncbi:MAG: T9SS type A sorting domain-containing protein, partial [Flavobacterium sp.]